MSTRREVMSYIGAGAIGGIIGFYAGAQELLGIQSEETETAPDSDTPTETEPPIMTEPGQVEIGEPIADLNIDDGLCAKTDDVFYFQSSNRINRYERSEDTVTDLFPIPPRTEGGRASGLAYGNESLWFSDATQQNYDGRIIEINPRTGEQRSEINLGVDIPALAFGNGSLWAADITSNSILEFSPNGDQVNRFDVRGPANTTGPQGLAYFQNALYLGEGGNNGVHTFNLDGTYRGNLNIPDRGYNSLAATGAGLFGTNTDGDLIIVHHLDNNS